MAHPYPVGLCSSAHISPPTAGPWRASGTSLPQETFHRGGRAASGSVQGSEPPTVLRDSVSSPLCNDPLR